MVMPQQACEISKKNNFRLTTIDYRPTCWTLIKLELSSVVNYFYSVASLADSGSTVLVAWVGNIFLSVINGHVISQAVRRGISPSKTRI